MNNYVVKIGVTRWTHSMLAHPCSSHSRTTSWHYATTPRTSSLCSGGGPQIATLLDDLGLTSHFHEGLRITDDRTMEYVAMALSQVNLHLVAALSQAGLVCVGLSGADGSTFSTSALGAPWGRVGASPKVDTGLIETLWNAGVTPVMTSIAG